MTTNADGRYVPYFATDRMAEENDNRVTVTVPADLQAGQYL